MLPPCRLIDTRNASGPLGGPSIAGGATRLFAVAGACGVPIDARSISANLTAVAPKVNGYITVFPGDISLPPTSTVSFKGGKTRANNLLIGLSSDGRETLAVYNASSGSVDVVLDVSGYFR